MGRKLADHTITTVRLDLALVARVDARVGAGGRSKFIRESIVKLLDELDEEDAAVDEALAKVRANRVSKAKRP